MQITTALLCDWAEVREGLLFITGAPVTRLRQPAFPAPMMVCLALILEGTQGEVGQPHEIQVIVRDADGGLEAEVRLGVQVLPEMLHLVEPGELIQVPLALRLFEIGMAGPGAHEVRIRVDGGEPVGQPERVVTLVASS